jgi:hypothetical protein
MVPEGLQKILDAIDYIEYDVDIVKLDISKDPLVTEFKIYDTEGSNEMTTVAMMAFDHRDFYIDKEMKSSYIHLESDHPLLWQYKDVQCELYISGGRPKEIEKIIFDLLRIHDSLFREYVPFDLDVLRVLNNGHGFLKKGSRKLLMKYVDSLTRYGVTTSVIGGIEPLPHMQDLKILFIGHSYFVATRFEFQVLTF